MNTFDPERRKLCDEQVEGLLHDFFDAEMPADLRELGDAPPPRPTSRAPASRNVAGGLMKTRAAWMGAATVAVVAVLAIAFMAFREKRPATDQAPLGMATADHNFSPLPALSSGEQGTGAMAPLRQSTGSGSLPPRAEENRGASPMQRAVNYSVSENVASLGRQTYATQQGPVEQHTHLRTTNVSFYEPKSGSQVQMTVPELEIEILAVNGGGI